MARIIIAIVVTLILCGLALRANRRLCHRPVLPMQWGLRGQVTWWAPRVLALTLMPALAAFTFATLLVISAYQAPRPGQEELVIPIFIGLGLLFVAVQILHHWLIARHFRRTGD